MVSRMVPFVCPGSAATGNEGVPAAGVSVVISMGSGPGIVSFGGTASMVTVAVVTVAGGSRTTVAGVSCYH